MTHFCNAARSSEEGRHIKIKVFESYPVYTMGLTTYICRKWCLRHIKCLLKSHSYPNHGVEQENIFWCRYNQVNGWWCVLWFMSLLFEKYVVRSPTCGAMLSKWANSVSWNETALAVCRSSTSIVPLHLSSGIRLLVKIGTVEWGFAMPIRFTSWCMSFDLLDLRWLRKVCCSLYSE